MVITLWQDEEEEEDKQGKQGPNHISIANFLGEER